MRIVRTAIDPLRRASACAVTMQAIRANLGEWSLRPAFLVASGKIKPAVSPRIVREALSEFHPDFVR